MPKRIIKILIILFILSALYLRYFLYIDFSNKCYIKLKPSFLELSSQNIKEALRVLRRVDPKEYTKVCEHVKTINPNFSCGGFGGGCYWSGRVPSGEIDISTARDSFLGMTAGIIAHETCHLIQHKEGREMSEKECYEVDDAVLKRVVVY